MSKIDSANSLDGSETSGPAPKPAKAGSGLKLGQEAPSAEAAKMPKPAKAKSKSHSKAHSKSRSKSQAKGNGKAGKKGKNAALKMMSAKGNCVAAPKIGNGAINPTPLPRPARKEARTIDKGFYEKELKRLQIELVKLQEWIKDRRLRVVVIFEGRDAAGKGGVIKRITESLNPRVCRVVALGTPTERERGQWYFQRYVAQLPAAGEMVLLDRSWYNRAGVERVMGFCSDEEYREFLRSAPEFERMLVRSDILLIKYWFSVSDEVQEERFQERLRNPAKRWKLSPMDLEARSRWFMYSKAKDDMFFYTDIQEAPWWVVDADNKKRARLNCIHHLLSRIAYEDLTPKPITLPARQEDVDYVRPPIEDQHFVPEVY